MLIKLKKLHTSYMQSHTENMIFLHLAIADKAHIFSTKQLTNTYLNLKPSSSLVHSFSKNICVIRHTCSAKRLQSNHFDHIVYYQYNYCIYSNCGPGTLLFFI